MERLLPWFLHQRLDQAQFEGEITASIIFADLKGFTSLTENLMKNGSEGAEVMTQILEKFFDPLINVVVQNKGFVSNFSGDAFLAIFPGQETDVQTVAARLQQAFREVNPMKTRFGTYELGFTCGAGKGTVKWAIYGKNKKHFYFYGEGIEKATASEPFTDLSLAVPFHNANWKPQKEWLKEQHFSMFYPSSITRKNLKGEFRNVASVFLQLGNPSKENLRCVIDTCDEAARFYSGYVNKIEFLDKGCQLLLLFGAPQSGENNALNAVRAVHYIQGKLSQLHITTRAGLSYGKVYAGYIGSRKRYEYSVISNTVNLAARLAGKAAVNQVLFDGHVANETSREFLHQEVEIGALKGIGEKIQVYKLMGVKGKLNTSEDVYIGRKNEWRKIVNQASSLKKHLNAGAVFLQGEAGSGKSRFVSEFLGKSNFNHIHFNFQPNAPEAFSVFRKYFHDVFNQSQFATSEQNLLNFNNGWSRFLSTFSHEFIEELEKYEAVFKALCNLDDDTSWFAKLDGRSRHDNIVSTIRLFLHGKCHKAPFIYVFEDVHWADEDSAKAIMAAFYGAEKLPFMALFSSRNEDNPVCRSFSGFNVKRLDITLDNFSLIDTQAFTKAQLNKQPSDSLVKLLFEKTGGNVLFLQQLIKYLVSHNLLHEVDGELMPHTSTEHIPPTVSDLLVSVIDSLPHQLKEFVKLCSVVGREFNPELVQKSFNVKDVGKLLESGINYGIWQVQQNGTYLFSHAFLRGAAYDLQLKKHLRNLHHKLAEVIEQDVLHNKNYHEAGWHFEQSGKLQKTILYYGKSSVKAADEFANILAIEFNNRIINLIESRRAYKKLKVDKMLENCYLASSSGNLLLSQELTIKARNEAIINKCTRQKALAELYFGRINILTGKPSEAVGPLTVSKKIFLKKDDQKHLSEIYFWFGHMKRDQEKFGPAVLNLKKSLTFDNPDDSFRAQVYLVLGSVYRLKKKYEKCLYYYKKAIGLLEKNKIYRGLAYAKMNTANLLDTAGKPGEAIPYYKEAAEIFAKTNDKSGMAVCKGNMAICLSNMNSNNESLPLFNEAITETNQSGYFRALPFWYFEYARSLMKLKFIGEAIKQIDLGIENSIKFNNNNMLMKSYLLKAELLCDERKFKKSKKLMELVYEGQLNDELTADAGYLLCKHYKEIGLDGVTKLQVATNTLKIYNLGKGLGNPEKVSFLNSICSTAPAFPQLNVDSN